MHSSSLDFPLAKCRLTFTQYDGRVVVDPVFHYVEYGPPYDHLSWLDKTDVWRSETNDGSMNKFVNLDPKNPNLELEDSHYVLLCRYLRGFTLGTRKWGKMKMSKCLVNG